MIFGVAIEAFNEQSQQWEIPQPGQRYSAFQAGVQMANRTGALNEIEYSEFVMKAQAFADAINGEPDFPEMLHEVARARELDQLCADLDIQVVLHVVAIVVYQWRKKDLLRPMLVGDRLLPVGTPASADGVRQRLLALVLALASGACVAWVARLGV